MFRPNSTCTVYMMGDDADIYGRTSYTLAENVPCAVVSYDLSVQKSSVRADSSGSRGRAEQLEGVARFLFTKTAAIKNGDIVVKDAFVLEVKEVFPRYDVTGRLDHIEVDMMKTELPDALKA